MVSKQIKIAPKDMTKTTFTTKWGIYCYTVMSFRLKNAGGTYERIWLQPYYMT